MPLSAKAIKGKIDSVKNVGKITKAMELVSVSKMKRATDAVVRTRLYATRALEMLTNLSESNAMTTPLLSHGDQGRNLLVIVSSNKGLCGSFNVNLEKATRNFVGRIRNKRGAQIDAVCVGKRAEKIAHKLNLPIIASFVEFNEHISIEEAQSVRSLLEAEFMSEPYFNVVMIYTVFESALSNHVIARQILPVKKENVQNMLIETEVRARTPIATEDFESYTFEPNKELLLKEVLVRLIDIQVYQGLLESSASEHSSRMISMKNATDNARSLADNLTLSYNRARQAGITQEISEIASGANALLEV